MQVLHFDVTAFDTNCYVVKDGGEAIVIDPGDAPSPLLDNLQDCAVSHIINTHGHCDHCGGNAVLVSRTGAPLACHRDAVPLLRQISDQGRLFGFEFPPSPEPDRLLEEGDTVTVGEIEFRVLHVPGHSPGHIALVGPNLVFSGDVLFSGSIGRTDLMGGDHNQLIASIHDKLMTLDDRTVVYCGHGPATTIGSERSTNPFLTAP